MANWEKLNKELDHTLNSMTFEDWELLASKRINQTTRTMKEKIYALITLIVMAISLTLVGTAIASQIFKGAF